MTTLIIGGSSGLGLELARRCRQAGDTVIITGRTDPHEAGVQFIACDLVGNSMRARIQHVVANLPHVNRLIYSAGFYQDGRLDDLSEADIEAMFDIGARGLVYVARDILHRQQELDELVVITSTSQWTVRQREPLYNYVKAGQGQLAHALAEDGRVSKILVAGPGSMDTPFWRKAVGAKPDGTLDPVWVAEQISDQLVEDYRYRCIRLPRKPPRVEIIESY